MANRSPHEPTLDPEFIYRENVSRLIGAKTRPFSVSGRIPLDPSHLVLFFRSKSGVTHSLDFPVDIDYSSPPALDVLIAACKRHQGPSSDGHLSESLYYPPNLPLTASLEIANHPILDAIRNTLFPTLPIGHYLTVRRDRVDVILTGGRLAPQPRAQRADGRAATLSVTLPVRFRGGSLLIRDGEGNQERLDTAAPTSDLEWTAWLAACDVEVEAVTQGCRVSISYAVFAKSFGAADPLFAPSQPFLDLLPPVLQMSRGRRIAFLLAHDYDVDPSVLLAESLVPSLRGGDSMLYHALKLYKLQPVLHWTAGGYLWPVDRTVEIFDEAPSGSIPPMQMPSMIGAYSSPPPPAPVEGLRARVEASGAVLLADAEVTLLTDWRAPEGGAPVGKARVHFVAEGMLEKLVVNVLLVAFVL